MRFRIAIPAVVAVDIVAETEEQALAEARKRQMDLYASQHWPTVDGGILSEYGENGALWAAGDHRWEPEVWDAMTEEPKPDDDWEPPEGETFRGGEAAAYRQEQQASVQRNLKRVVAFLALLAAGACSSPSEPVEEEDRRCLITQPTGEAPPDTACTPILQVP